MTLRAYLDRTPSLGPGVYVDPRALVIGDVTLGENSSVWPMTVIQREYASQLAPHTARS